MTTESQHHESSRLKLSTILKIAFGISSVFVIAAFLAAALIYAMLSDTLSAINARPTDIWTYRALYLMLCWLPGIVAMIVVWRLLRWWLRRAGMIAGRNYFAVALTMIMGALSPLYSMIFSKYGDPAYLRYATSPRLSRAFIMSISS